MSNVNQIDGFVKEPEITLEGNKILINGEVVIDISTHHTIESNEKISLMLSSQKNMFACEVKTLSEKNWNKMKVQYFVFQQGENGKWFLFAHSGRLFSEENVTQIKIQKQLFDAGIFFQLKKYSDGSIKTLYGNGSRKGVNPDTISRDSDFELVKIIPTESQQSDAETTESVSIFDLPKPKAIVKVTNYDFGEPQNKYFILEEQNSIVEIQPSVFYRDQIKSVLNRVESNIYKVKDIISKVLDIPIENLKSSDDIQDALEYLRFMSIQGDLFEAIQVQKAKIEKEKNRQTYTTDNIFDLLASNQKYEDDQQEIQYLISSYEKMKSIIGKE